MKEKPPQDTGFTVVELVVVIVLLGILSVYAVPRFVGVASFETSGFYQETVSAARYAHQLAVGRGCPVRISFVTSDPKHGYILETRNNCRTGNFTPIPDTHPVSAHKDKDIIISSDHNATFDALGRCSQGCEGNLTISVDGRVMTIYEETGYVDTSL